MSEPTPPNGSEPPPDTIMANEEDQTQPAQDILAALRQLSNSQQTNPNTQPSQQDVNQSTSRPSQPSQPTQQAESGTPASEWDGLRARVREKPSDVDAWLRLVDTAEDGGNFEQINETYEALLEAYPNTSSAQIAYINHVLESSSPTKYQYAEALFKRFLKTSPFVDLWKYYLSYVRKINTGPNTRDTVRKAYEFALNHIGHDKESTDIWKDYIQFLKAGEAATTWDEGQKMEAIRKAYQRAIQIPMDDVKRMWEDYQEFENNLNKITAKKFISDLSASHMQARTVLSALQEHLATLFPPNPQSKTKAGSIYLPQAPTFNANDKALVGRWRQYLKWEESNPLEIEEKEKTSLHTRLQAVYRKAVVRMRFFAEIWYMSYAWNLNLSNDQSLPEAKRKDRKEEALNILKAGIEANPSSFVLNFAYAEALEANKSYDEVHSTFDKFLDVLRTDLQENEERANAAAANASQTTDIANLSQSSSSSSNSQGSDDSKSGKNKEILDRRTEYGLAWIVYMRFARRAENLKSARNVFSKARRDKWTPWEVYEAAALMEYHCTKAPDVAMRIFEKGLENFPDEVELALRYLGFLISINDDANARALFERIVGSFPADRARPIWERWARYEYQFGSFEAAQLLDKRMAEAYPNDPPIKRFAERHKYLGTDAIAVRDLGFIMGRSNRSNGLSRTGTQDSSASLISPQLSQSQPASVTKRPSSPEPASSRRRDEPRGGDFGPPSKRQRAASPTSSRGHDRERWEKRRFESPSGWGDRDGRGRDPRKQQDREREEDRGGGAVTLPQVLSWFMTQLPKAQTFDGPVFRTDDLMQVFRNASIPSSTGIRARSPPPRPGGRPGPDYSPYQGPGGPRRGRY